MFRTLGRDTLQLGGSRYVHVTCSEQNTEHICSKSDGLWAAPQKPAVELIQVFSIIPT